jgi:predicted SnoaL-like aldol condensation-catalyzing enzyme
MAQEDNRKIVLDFYDVMVNRKDFDAASAYLGDHYIQHEAHAPDGVEGLRRFLTKMSERVQQGRIDVRRVFVDGDDDVILHAHVVPTPGERGSARVAIFRVGGGKVVEHWSVTEPIPAETASSNGVF